MRYVFRSFIYQSQAGAAMLNAVTVLNGVQQSRKEPDHAVNQAFDTLDKRITEVERLVADIHKRLDTMAILQQQDSARVS